MKPPSRNSLKQCKVGHLRDMLVMRGLSTEGTKPVLVERLYTTLPYVRFEIDARECLQRVVNAFLYYFGWDNTHLWSMDMPRRGDLQEGVIPLMNHLGLVCFEWSIKSEMEKHGSTCPSGIP